MKPAALLLVLSLLPAPAQAADYPPLFWDVTHIIISVSVPFAIHDCLRAMKISRPVATWTALGTTTAACAAKELLLDDKPSWRDVACNVAGLSFAAVMLLKFGK